MRVPPLLLVACAVGVAHATTERPCDVEGVAVTRGSTKYVVGRPHQRGAIFAKCDAHGTVTCFEDGGLADAPAWAFPRVSCDARTIHARRRKLGVAINLAEDKWPNGLVFYRFNDKYPLADHERDMVRQAIKMYEGTDLGVAFQECEPKSLCDNKYVDISQKEDACYSYVGFTGDGGGQIMNLGKSCFDEPGIAVHELGHALGLYHEHTHPQREVIVLTDSDLPVSASNYAKETDAFLKPYDKGSIMHYGRSAGLCLPKDQYPLESFCDVEVTTNCVMPKKTHCNNTRNNEIGQRSTLSPGDLNTLKAIYGTNKPTLKPTTAPVPSSPAPSPEPTSSPPSSSPSPSATTDAPSSTTSEDTPVPTTKAPEPPSTSPPPPTTTAPPPSSTTGPPTAPPTPQPSTTAPAPSTTVPTATTTAPTPSTTTGPTTTAPVPTTTTPPAPTATKAPSATTLAPAMTTTTPSASQSSPPSTPTKRPDTAGSKASSPAPTTKAPSRPVTPSPAAQTTTRPATQRPTSTQRPAPTKRPTPTTEAPYRPGNVIPDHNSPAWWEWWNQNKGNKKWADLPRPESNGKWWSAWPDNQQDVAGESDAKNPYQPWQPTKQQQQPTWSNKPMMPPQPQPQPKPKTGYSFRGWWGR